MANRSTASFKLDGFLGIIFLVAIFVGIFFLLQGVFFVLKWVAPALLVAAFIIDRSVVINYVKWLGKLVQRNPLVGIGAILLSLLGYMVVCPYLFAKALFKKKLKEVSQEYEKTQKGEFVDYEEISSEPKREEPLELPRIEKMERKQPRNDYEDMF